MATVVAGDGEREVRIEALEVGDLVRVRPGQRVPVDGVVVDGRSAVDERMLTGESLPVERAAGDPLIGGTLNGSGALVARVTRVGDDTALAQIVALVEDAQGSLPPSQRLADTVSAYFVPGILAVAVVTFAGWMLLGPEPRLPAALQAAVAVLIVACPCALGLATPTAVMVAAGRAAEMGILVRSGEALERARRIDTMVLDKTGTLTRGRPVVSRVVPASGWTEEELLAIAAAAELGSEHPVGEAVVAHARESGVEPAVASAFEALAGQGVSATVDRREVLAGSPRLMRRLGIELDGMADASRELVAMGGTSMLVAVDRRPAGVIGVTDSLKPGAAETVRQLRELGLDVWMVTGDGRGVAEAVAREAGIEHVLAEVLPHEKADQIRELQSRGHRVAMVGDGINDAPALAQADVGIAIGTGADVALAASDITLVGGDLAGIVTALALSRRTVAVIQQGLFWAFAYNLLLVPLATGALFPLVRVLLTPALAAAAMALSSVSVVTNALRLRRFRRPDRVRDIVRPPLTARLREVGYLASIALVAGGIGAASLGAVQRAAVGATAVPAAQAGIHARLSIPAGVQPDVPARLVYRLSSASDGGPFTGVVASHDRLMHLVVVASDLARFQHLHPIPTGAPGEYAVDVRFPVAGSYQLFDEFATAAGQDVVLRDSVTVTGARPATVPLRSDSSPKVRGDYSVALLGAGDLLWGRPSRLTFSVTSAATGLPAHNLRPYLGAAAHVSIVRQDASWFLHAHGMSPGSAPMTMGMGLAAGPGAGGGHSDAAGEVGPRIDVEPAFPGPGLYKIWGQFEAPDGSVITADYVVRVH
jgi:Cu+-exporting ATPase